MTTMDNPKPSGSQLPTADSQTAPASTQPEASKTRWPRQRQRRKPGNASTSATAQVPITAESSTAPTAPTNEPSPTSNTPAHRPGKPRRSKNKAPENSAKVANSANHAEPSSQSNAHSSSTPTTKDKRQPRRRHAKKLFSQLSDPAQPSASGEVARGKVPEHLIPELPADADLRTTLEHNLRHGTHECMVCYDFIRPHAKTWVCECCWAVFHLHCIKQWAKESIGKRMATSATTPTNHFHPQHNDTNAQPSLLSHVTISYDRHLSQRERRRAHRNAPMGSHSGAATHHLHHAVFDALPEAPMGDQMTEQDAPWTCPGCHHENRGVPKQYFCFCGKQPWPEWDPSTTPHSCGQTCSKLRTKRNDTNNQACPHPCILPCHPGPCPPCTALAPLTQCFCGKQWAQVRCSTYSTEGHSCGQPCGALLECGEHACDQPCHSGFCATCSHIEVQRCYCGRTAQEMTCGTGHPQQTYRLEPLVFNGHPPGLTEPSEEVTCLPPECEADRTDLPIEHTVTLSSSLGYFACDRVCNETYACGLHTCPNPCHPRHRDVPPCPLDPSQLTTCPCRKTLLAELSSELRQQCTDPIPTCAQPCERPLPCGHACQSSCHHGPCPSCSGFTTMTCRCGRGRHQVLCQERFEFSSTTVDASTADKMARAPEVQNYLIASRQCYTKMHPRPDFAVPRCDQPCNAVKNCGQHRCEELCCSGDIGASVSLDAAGTHPHTCQETCERTRSCKRHLCDSLCHSGPCPPCPEVSMQEQQCPCGHVRLSPPVPCGATLPECTALCTRPRPCGHAQTNHTCHPDDTPCAPCPALVKSICYCGKPLPFKTPCYRGRGNCGSTCDKPLPCERHVCSRPCHEGPCIGYDQECHLKCQRPRPTCGHPCSDMCHELTVCLESPTPCPELVVKYCPCGSRSEEQPCGATAAFIPESRVSCTQICATIQRNRQLAEAFADDATAISSPASLDRLRLSANSTSGLPPASKYEIYHPYSSYHSFFKTIPSTVVIPQFDNELLEFVFTHSKWVQDHYTRFIRPFMEDPRQSILRFKPMNPTFRQTLHLWAQAYFIDSESQDSGANRSVVWSKKTYSDCGSSFPLTYVLKVPLRVWHQIAQLHSQSSPTGAHSAIGNDGCTDESFGRGGLVDRAHESGSRYRGRQFRTKDLFCSLTIPFNAFILANVPTTVASPDPIIRALGDEFVGLQVFTQWWSPAQGQHSGEHSHRSPGLSSLGRHLIITPIMDGTITATSLHDLVLDLCPLLQEALVQRHFGDYVEPYAVDHSGQLVQPHPERGAQRRSKVTVTSTTTPAPAAKSAWSAKPPNHTNAFRALNSPQVSAWDAAAAMTPGTTPPHRPLAGSGGVELGLTSPTFGDVAPMKLPVNEPKAQTALLPPQPPIVADSWEELEELL